MPLMNPETKNKRQRKTDRKYLLVECVVRCTVVCVWWQDGMVLISAGWWVYGGRVCRLLMWPQAQKHTNTHTQMPRAQERH